MVKVCCFTQISRPQVLSTSVVVSDICVNEPHLQLTDDGKLHVQHGKFPYSCVLLNEDEITDTITECNPISLHCIVTS